MVQGRSEQPSRAAVRAYFASTKVSALDIGNLRPDGAAGAGCPFPRRDGGIQVKAADDLAAFISRWRVMRVAQDVRR